MYHQKSVLTFAKHSNTQVIMKKSILMAAGIAGLFLAHNPIDAQAEIGVRVGGINVNVGDRPTFVIDTRPTFIYVPELGFSVAVRSPYNFIFLDGYYYINRDGHWYSSSHFRGPWNIVRFDRLPHAIREHRWEEIRRFRDREYRRHDRQYWERSDRPDNHDRRDDRNQLREENRDLRNDRNR
jgi:hypothetical protein